MTQINWQYQVNNRAGGYIVTNTDWNDVAGDLRALIDQTTSSTTDNTPLPIGIDLVNDRVYISDPDSTTPEDGNHADTTLSVVGTTTLNGNTQQTGTFNVGVDDTGHDVKFHGATAGKSWLWDESGDTMFITGGTLLYGDLTVGVDDTGYDVKLFGATSGSYALWDESDDALRLVGADLVPASALGNRNKIINGDMRVSQREQTYTTATGGGTRYYPADRFWTGDYTWSAGADIVISRDDAVYPAGFSQSYKVLSGGTGLTYASGGHTDINYFVEAQDLEPYYAETAMTLSFWCRSTDTGIFNVLFTNGWYGSGRADRGLTKEFTISVADTWEQKTIEFDLAAGTAAGTWKTGTDEGLLIAWMLGGNANRTGDSYLDTWATWSALDLNTDSNIQLMTGANSNFYLTGVQLEVGSNATPFEHRDIASELARCQRYYQRTTSTGIDQAFASGVFLSATQPLCSLTFPPMRAAPTVTFHGGSGTIDAVGGGAAFAATSVVGQNITLSTMQIGGTVSGASSGGGCVLRQDSGYFDMSAEL